MNTFDELMNERSRLWATLKEAQAAYEEYLTRTGTHDLTDEVTGAYAEAKQALKTFDLKIDQMTGVS